MTSELHSTRSTMPMPCTSLGARWEGSTSGSAHRHAESGQLSSQTLVSQEQCLERGNGAAAAGAEQQKLLWGAHWGGSCRPASAATLPTLRAPPPAAPGRQRHQLLSLA